MRLEMIVPEHSVDCPQESGAYLPINAIWAWRGGLGPRQTQIRFSRSRTNDVVGWEECIIPRSIMTRLVTNTVKAEVCQLT
jgi:hypothetical protein